MQNTSRAEAERLLGIAEKLLQNRDLNSSRDFAILAQETEPLLEGSDQIIAIVDVLSAAEKPLNNSHLDWYAILQVDRRSQDLDLIKKNYRRLALLLHPYKNPFTLADHAFKLVADAWAVLSDPIQKHLYDKGISVFSRLDLSLPGWVQQDKLPVRRGNNNNNNYNNNHPVGFDEPVVVVAADDSSRRRVANFWTACPYCYLLYEYPRVYEGCCLRCQNCERSFHGVSIPSLPLLVPGQEAYYCCWGFFPMGFVFGTLGSERKGLGAVPPPAEVHDLIPPPPTQFAAVEHVENGGIFVEPVARVGGGGGGVSNGVGFRLGSGAKKRGRPRKVV